MEQERLAGGGRDRERAGGGPVGTGSWQQNTGEQTQPPGSAQHQDPLSPSVLISRHNLLPQGPSGPTSEFKFKGTERNIFKRVQTFP